MCFSATASFAAAALLVPAGVAAAHRAWRTDRRYLALCALPLLLGLQQFAEGMVWIAGSHQDAAAVASYSLTYMFFTWLLWPVWVPFAAYFIEPASRKPLYLLFAIAGGMVGAMQYFPYFAYEDWLTTTFLDHAIRYGGVELFDLIIGRNLSYALYLSVILAPLLISSDREVRIFGGLVFLVFIITYVFFRTIYVSAFCVGAAVVSVYLVQMIFRRPAPRIRKTVPV